AYTIVLFVFAPLLVLTGLALSPGVDAMLPITAVFGGRQFARLWHFVIMIMLIGFFLTHISLVATQGVFNQMRSMVTGWFKLGSHDGVGV
nr:cytochrome b/b6 domain-containing protein [Candidatus Eremiobacteraeota bacterium]